MVITKYQFELSSEASDALIDIVNEAVKDAKLKDGPSPSSESVPVFPRTTWERFKTGRRARAAIQPISGSLTICGRGVKSGSKWRRTRKTGRK